MINRVRKSPHRRLVRMGKFPPGRALPPLLKRSLAGQDHQHQTQAKRVHLEKGLLAKQVGNDSQRELLIYLLVKY